MGTKVKKRTFAKEPAAPPAGKPKTKFQVGEIVELRPGLDRSHCDKCRVARTYFGFLGKVTVKSVPPHGDVQVRFEHSSPELRDREIPVHRQFLVEFSQQHYRDKDKDIMAK